MLTITVIKIIVKLKNIIMTQEEKIKIWDATEPTIAEVKEYLKRLCGQTPLQLVFRNQKKELVYSNTILTDHTFVGILVSQTIFFAQGYTVNELKKEENGELKEVYAKDVFNWVENNPLFPPNSRPLLKSDRQLLSYYKQDFLNTLEILEYHRVKMPYYRYDIGWLEGNNDSRVLLDNNGETLLNYFLQCYGDIWVCNSEIAK